MSRTMKTIVQALAAIALMALLSVIVYYLGGILAKPLLTAESVGHTDWMKDYFGLVRMMGIGSALLLLLWFVLARFVLRASDPLGAGKRTVWAVLLFLSAVFSIVAPYVYHAIHHRPETSIMFVVLFLVFYTLVGFWGGSLFVTPDAYKYTPIGGAAVRSPKNRK